MIFHPCCRTRKRSSWMGTAIESGSRRIIRWNSKSWGGHAKLEEGSLRPMFVRISRHLWQILEGGRYPSTDISDIVEWDPSEYNTVADHSANIALDKEEEWFDDHLEKLRLAQEQGANTRLCFDGARRGSGAGAGRLAIFAYWQGDSQLLYKAGRPVGYLSPSSVAESIAFEWGLEEFWRLWRRA